MKQLKIKFTKEIINKARDDINLILFSSKGYGIKEMKLVNNMLGGLKNAKIDICYD